MREVHEPAMSGKTPCVAGVPAGATVAPSDRVDGDGWFTVNDADSSPLERVRDAQIERRIERDGRPLSLLAIVAHQRGTRWEIELLHRVDLLARLDARGRDAKHDSDRKLSKKLAAWVRGLPHGVCPELFTWETEGGGRCVQRATIERAKGGRR